MKKVSKKAIRDYIRLGLAIDITNASPDAIPAHYEKIAICRGTYGMNGGIIRDTSTGQLYAITARNSNLFRVF